MANDNIVAISTGLVASGVAVIRMSGDSPLKIAEKVFTPCGKIKVKDFEPNKMYVGEVQGEGFKDFGMCVYFKSPKSFTGEDTIEFHIHGGLAITQGILRYILSLGVRLANNGEFTKRAFMNGKLSLASAEGLIDMINSESVSAVKAGYYLYREKLTNKVKTMQERLTDVLAEVDADMDFPEEDLEKSSRESVLSAVESVLLDTDGLISSFRRGRILKNGVSVAICGKPNTGKSSLLNALLNYDKAIVSDIAGTTRDVVEGSIDINGVRFNFCDTAGIRETGDKIETLGVELSKRVLKQSDLIILVLDAENIDDEDKIIYEEIQDKNHIVVVNKIDKSDKKYKDADIYISASENLNIEKLKQEMFVRSVGKNADVNGDFLCEERHLEALKKAQEKLLSAKDNLKLESVPLDIVAIDIKDGWDCLGEISGLTANEEIINNIFSKFCVGK